ncbi:MAG TPA: hypothetical protein VFJ72_14920 [Rubrobacteraceae bacterium]|nr:hypothetical protein [Rubrobacteraceae bacterium]
MFEGLNWSNALKRAAMFTGIWLALVYVMHAINPKLFKLGDSGDFLVLALNAVLFFFLYAAFFAFMERRKNRNQKTSSSKKTGTAKNDDEAEPGRFKGQVNPNTSRKKAARRRR